MTLTKGYRNGPQLRYVHSLSAKPVHQAKLVRRLPQETIPTMPVFQASNRLKGPIRALDGEGQAQRVQPDKTAFE